MYITYKKDQKKLHMDRVKKSGWDIDGLIDWMIEDNEKYRRFKIPNYVKIKALNLTAYEYVIRRYLSKHFTHHKSLSVSQC